MTELDAIYRRALPGRIAALETARAAGGDASVATIRRIAHSLRGSGGTYGYPQVSEAAAAVEDAPADKVSARLDELIALLRSLATAPEEADILVVEDEPDHALLIRAALDKPGRNVMVATSAAEARREIAERRVSLILLDLFLPDRDGRALLLELRERPETESTPIIILSAKSDARAKAECFELGANGFLEKPVDVDLLQAVVSSQLRSTVRGAAAAPDRTAANAGITDAAGGASIADDPAGSDEATRHLGLPCVLVVEDDPLVASVLRHRLERGGMRIVHCADGAAAMQAVERESIALAILDVKVPGMDGFDLLTRLRSRPETAATPVIMLTALGGEKDVLRGFQLGADDYIIKPFSPVEVLARVKRLLAE